jgi:hypothetical protein
MSEIEQYVTIFKGESGIYVSRQRRMFENVKKATAHHNRIARAKT